MWRLEADQSYEPVPPEPLPILKQQQQQQQHPADSAMPSFSAVAECSDETRSNMSLMVCVMSLCYFLFFCIGVMQKGRHRGRLVSDGDYIRETLEEFLPTPHSRLRSFCKANDFLSYFQDTVAHSGRYSSPTRSFI